VEIGVDGGARKAVATDLDRQMHATRRLRLNIILQRINVIVEIVVLLHVACAMKARFWF